MAHEVIMPQLGMTQDVGVIVTWRKQPGDFVTAGEVLMEVETDKAVMEVDAEHTGYLRQIICVAGESAPVGQVIALISDQEDSSLPSLSSAVTPPKVTQTPVIKPAPSSPQPLTNVPNTNVATLPKRILSSPKARVRAQELGVDLDTMRAHHLPEPFHVTDVEKFAALPQAIADCISIEAPSDAFMAFVRWAATESDQCISLATVVRAFAARAWRTTKHSDMVIAYIVPGKTTTYFSNCDLSGLGKSEPIVDNQHTDLVLYNLIDLGLSDYQPGHPLPAPALLVSANIRGRINAIMRFQKQSLSLAEATAFLRNFSMQLTTPLKYLL